MPSLDSQLARVAKQIRKSIAPALGADIVEVWRPRQGDEPSPGGTMRDRAGNTLRTAPVVATPTSPGMAFQAAYYCRVAPQLRNATEGDFGGQNTSVVPHVFVFNAGDRPELRASDALRIAVKRQERQSLAELGWQPNTSYPVGAREQPSASNGCTYKRTSGTVSGALEPYWPHIKGLTVFDGDGVWECEGKSPLFEIISPGGYDTNAAEIVVSAERKGEE
jgi:hypothetical protein